MQPRKMGFIEKNMDEEQCSPLQSKGLKHMWSIKDEKPYHTHAVTVGCMFW